jgi:hypothetical protein
MNQPLADGEPGPGASPAAPGPHALFTHAENGR